MNSYIRPRGILVWKMPSEVSGPDSYALLVHPTKSEARMVHTEGVAYLVTPEKPWTHNDYDPECPSFTYTELLDLIPSLEIAPTDLADWIRSHNARLDSNFAQVAHWAVTD